MIIETNLDWFKKQLKQMDSEEAAAMFFSRVIKHCDLNVRYIHEREVQQKRFAFLKFKCNFLVKLILLHEKTKIQLILAKLHLWIHKNIDKLFELFKDH